MKHFILLALLNTFFGSAFAGERFYKVEIAVKVDRVGILPLQEDWNKYIPKGLPASMIKNLPFGDFGISVHGGAAALAGLKVDLAGKVSQETFSHPVLSFAKTYNVLLSNDQQSIPIAFNAALESVPQVDRRFRWKHSTSYRMDIKKPISQRFEKIEVQCYFVNNGFFCHPTMVRYQEARNTNYVPIATVSNSIPPQYSDKGEHLFKGDFFIAIYQERNIDIVLNHLEYVVSLDDANYVDAVFEGLAKFKDHFPIILISDEEILDEIWESVPNDTLIFWKDDDVHSFSIVVKGSDGKSIAIGNHDPSRPVKLTY